MDEQAQFALSCELLGHEADVRGVAPFDSGMFASASRDRSVRIWTPNDAGSYDTQLTLYGHDHYVVPVVYIPANPVLPSPSVASGSHDKTVIVWNLDSGQPHLVLRGHEDVVCALTFDPVGGLLVSGSWDKTARVWKGSECIATLRGHEASVLCVLALSDGTILTGSADATVRRWQSGTCSSVIKGDAGPVRALVAVPGVGFLSCGNDCRVRLWDSSGAAIQTMEGHSNYVYGLAVSGDTFASGGEDKSLKLWRGGRVVQTIMHPATIWALTFLPNGDLVCGCSDGGIRVWTRERSRIASAETIAKFESQVSNQTISKKQVGDISVEKLPGPEALYVPGVRDGEYKMVKVDKPEGLIVECHQWNLAAARWEKIGDVTDATSESSKQTLNGVAYDHVFDVDLGEGSPNLKLGYNAGQNPYDAAQKFLWDNDLHQGYLDVVARFIIDNTKGFTIDAAPAQQEQQLLGDPLTGGSRYIPRSGQTAAPAAQARPSATTLAAAAASPAPAPTPTQAQPASPFPCRQVLTFDSTNYSALQAKLSEFNSALFGSSATAPLALSPAEQTLVGVLLRKQQDKSGYSAAVFSDDEFAVVVKLLNWPADKQLPVLDLIRLLMLIPSVAQGCSAPARLANPATNVASLLLAIAGRTTEASLIMLIVRCFANMFAHTPLPAVASSSLDRLLEWTASLTHTQSKTVRLTLATLILNFAVAFIAQRNDLKLQVVSQCVEFLTDEQDGESAFRAIVALGTLVYQDEQTKQTAVDCDARAVLQRLSTHSDQRVNDAVARLLAQL